MAIGLGQTKGLGESLAMLGVLLAIVIVLGMIVLYVRGRTLRGPVDHGEASLFDNLQKMRERGEITEEEYQAARRSIVERLAGRGGSAERTVGHGGGRTSGGNLGGR